MDFGIWRGFEPITPGHQGTTEVLGKSQVIHRYSTVQGGGTITIVMFKGKLYT